ncbi:MAG TPA: hypothetical protein VKU19_30770 [Bryobacteraceae bacterium]|nr:hypothetical protein [Bryobacteraceae bacterium]
MERKRENEDAESALARALGRSFARRQFRSNLEVIAILLGGAAALIAIQILLKQSYYLVMATQLGLPWILYLWLALRGPVGVFISWMCSSVVCFILTMGYIGYASLVDRTTSVAAACILGLILFAAIAIHCPEILAKDGRPIAVFVYCFVVVYSYHAIFQANCVLDRSPITVYRPLVLQKVYGFRAQGLLVEAWSPAQGLSPASLMIRRGAAMVAPSRGLFNAVDKGDSICVVQRKGELGMSWYTAQLRTWNGGPVALGPWGRSF